MKGSEVQKLFERFLVVIIWTFIAAFFVQWLWNWIVTYTCGWRSIGYWQAFGLIVLVRCCLVSR